MVLVGTRSDDFRQTQPPAVAVASREFARGIAFHRQGKLDEAARTYARVLELDPGHAEALNNLGVVLRAQGKPEASVTAYERSLALRPDDPGLLGNLGTALRSEGKLERALSVLYRAVALAPKAPSVHHNLGLVLRDLGHYDEALGCFERSLSIWPNNVSVRIDRALTLLAKGHYPAGFAALEARFEADRFQTLLPGVPIWNGGEIEGESLLIRAEQNVGDVIQFCRFATAAKRAGGRTVFECHPGLVPLLRTLEGVDEVVAFGEREGEVDMQVPLLSLPRILQITPRSLPGRKSYLSAPEGNGMVIKHPSGSKLSVGIVWARQPEDGTRQVSSGPGLLPFFQLMRRPEVAIYALQRGAPANDVKKLGASGLLHDMSNFVTDFEDMARVAVQLDLIITADTTMAHLAGAMGRPVWLLLPHVADWRWALDRSTTPWYANMRLFRQNKPGDWDSVFDEVARELESLAQD